MSHEWLTGMAQMRCVWGGAWGEHARSPPEQSGALSAYDVCGICGFSATSHSSPLERTMWSARHPVVVVQG